MIELTDQQRQELTQPEPGIVALIEDALDIGAGYPLMDEAAAKAGWADPAMDIYNDITHKP